MKNSKKNFRWFYFLEVLRGLFVVAISVTFASLLTGLAITAQVRYLNDLTDWRGTITTGVIVLIITITYRASKALNKWLKAKIEHLLFN